MFKVSSGCDTFRKAGKGSWMYELDGEGLSRPFIPISHNERLGSVEAAQYMPMLLTVQMDEVLEETYTWRPFEARNSPLWNQDCIVSTAQLNRGRLTRLGPAGPHAQASLFLLVRRRSCQKAGVLATRQGKCTLRKKARRQVARGTPKGDRLAAEAIADACVIIDDESKARLTKWKEDVSMRS